MSRIRKIHIRRFRGIREFIWVPTPGINCLVGPGDSGKSTVLDAIDLCLGARRNVQFTDADFHNLSVEKPIQIAVTIGELHRSLKNLEAYGHYIRGFRKTTHDTIAEPEAGAEPVLTVMLSVSDDLEPHWTLYSENADAQGLSRNLAWEDRTKIAPTRLGTGGDYDLSWRRGSLLHKVTEDQANHTGKLAQAARESRSAFGDRAKADVKMTLDIVKEVANAAGVPAGDVTAMLDPQSASLSGGTISLHDGKGVPMRSLGLGSTRLIRAGLQRRASDEASIALVDEVEHGLEPHRMMRFITSLGAKETEPPLQVFMTTHSPVAIRELSAAQLYVLRPTPEKHNALPVAPHNVQGTIRACPEAFLAHSVIVCEGASEIGLVRGLDHRRVETGRPSVAAYGTASADGNGKNMYRRAGAFAKLGYRTILLRDSDNPPTSDDKAAYNGREIIWSNGRALEEELFASLSSVGAFELLKHAVKIVPPAWWTTILNRRRTASSISQSAKPTLIRKPDEFSAWRRNPATGSSVST